MAHDNIGALRTLDSVDWGKLDHAYGTAEDVPEDLLALASSDSARRKDARWNLGSTIYHQGDIFDSTAAAIPFLVGLASTPQIAERHLILAFLKEIAVSAMVSREVIRKGWEKRCKLSPDVYQLPESEMANRDIARCALVEAALRQEESRL